MKKVIYEWIRGGLRRIEIFAPDNPPIPEASKGRKRFNDIVDGVKKKIKFAAPCQRLKNL